MIPQHTHLTCFPLAMMCAQGIRRGWWRECVVVKDKLTHARSSMCAASKSTVLTQPGSSRRCVASMSSVLTHFEYPDLIHHFTHFTCSSLARICAEGDRQGWWKECVVVKDRLTQARLSKYLASNGAELRIEHH